MSKPLYMQLSDLQEKLNEEYRHRANLREDYEKLTAELNAVKEKLARVEAERDEARGECRHVDQELLRARAENDALHAQVQAAERERERWRHGVTIEGDFVCPDSLALTKTQKAAEGLREALHSATEALAWLAADKTHSVGPKRLAADIERARKALATCDAARAKP